MRKIFILAVVLGLSATAMMAFVIPSGKTEFKTAKQLVETGKWTVDRSHSNVKFTITHLVVSEVEGSFKMFDGSMENAKGDLSDAEINFTVDVNSIDTDNEKRDGHLKGDDFFNAEKYPTMSFTSTSFKKVKGNAYILDGNLTIRDVTKKVRFAVIYGGTIKDPWGNTKAGFKASGKINRKDFNLKWNSVTEAGGAVVGDEVKMIINVEFAQAKA
jgi:polyisoprenoid-binding protein YceI